VNPLSVDFKELYQRHLCRHSQFGINVEHLLCVIGTYLALYGLLVRVVWTLLPPQYALWAPVAVVVPYLAVLAPNLPPRVFLAALAFLALFFAVFFALVTAGLPTWPVWIYPLAVLVFYKLQAWSHKVYSKESDMTYFNQKYPKGLALFVLLSIYELPILLNYLFFGKRDWCR
jgi:hypothetical protein